MSDLAAGFREAAVDQAGGGFSGKAGGSLLGWAALSVLAISAAAFVVFLGWVYEWGFSLVLLGVLVLVVIAGFAALICAVLSVGEAGRSE